MPHPLASAPRPTHAPALPFELRIQLARIPATALRHTGVDLAATAEHQLLPMTNLHSPVHDNHMDYAARVAERERQQALRDAARATAILGAIGDVNADDPNPFPGTRLAWTLDSNLAIVLNTIRTTCTPTQYNDAVQMIRAKLRGRAVQPVSRVLNDAQQRELPSPELRATLIAVQEREENAFAEHGWNLQPATVHYYRQPPSGGLVRSGEINLVDALAPQATNLAAAATTPSELAADQAAYRGVSTRYADTLHTRTVYGIFGYGTTFRLQRTRDTGPQLALHVPEHDATFAGIYGTLNLLHHSLYYSRHPYTNRRSA